MLRDLLIDKKLFNEIRANALKPESWEEDVNRDIALLEKKVLKRLRKKRSAKKYRKNGVRKSDLKEIIELADISSLELFEGPSNSQIAHDHPEWCDDCGRCCRESSPIFIHKDEFNMIITFNPNLKDEITNNVYYPEHFMFQEDTPCKFHDEKTKRCLIYDSRPQVCRNYPLMMVGNESTAHNTINLRYNCNYAVNLVVEKSTILFDEAINRLKKIG